MLSGGKAGSHWETKAYDYRKLDKTIGVRIESMLFGIEKVRYGLAGEKRNWKQETNIFWTDKYSFS